MKMVMGALNGIWLQDLMSGAVGCCSRVTATVAYATHNSPFFEHCLKNKIYLDFVGLLDEDSAVSVSVLEALLRAGPLAASPRLIKGHFHSKIIWWHGYGAYIGSANLTSRAWSSNVECGVFYTEEEIIGTLVEQDLEAQFSYLKEKSSPVTSELLKSLKSLDAHRDLAYKAKKKLVSQFDEATKGIPTHAGLDAYKASSKATAYTRFTSEWNETLELLRGLGREFNEMGLRPKWVSDDADPTVHFDQFLHAFYYDKVRKEYEDVDTPGSVELVNRSFEKNRENKTLALREAAEWWASLEQAPYGEDVFIRETAPQMKTMFARDSLEEWTLEDFKRTMFEVHAFKMHARQIKNSTFSLPLGYKETVRERSDRLATWLWEQPRQADQKHVKELLLFLIWGAAPSDMAERLWLTTQDEQWCYNHLGRSSLGEAVGWARPSLCPPRNNRTNKALRSLGHGIQLFSS
jgi:hypothetical protein